jgi:hypothetical protein
MLTIDVVSASRVFRQIRAAGYPTVTGVMQKSELGESTDDESTEYFPVVQYSYTVAGKTYMGNRYRYGRESSNDKNWAIGIVAAHPVGSEVEVHHSPADPNDAVLVVGLQGSDLLSALVQVPFTLVALACCLPVGRAIRRRVRPAGADDVGKTDTAARSEDLHAEWFRYARRRPRLTFKGFGGKLLTPWRPIYTPCAVIGILSLLTAFVVKPVFGDPPPVQPMLVTWEVILGVGAFSYVFHALVAWTDR